MSTEVLLVAHHYGPPVTSLPIWGATVVNLHDIHGTMKKTQRRGAILEAKMAHMCSRYTTTVVSLFIRCQKASFQYACIPMLDLCHKICSVAPAHPSGLGQASAREKMWPATKYEQLL